MFFLVFLNSNRELKKEFMKKVRKLVKNKEAKDINVAKKMIKKKFLIDFPEIEDYCLYRYDEYKVLKKKNKLHKINKITNSKKICRRIK